MVKSVVIRLDGNQGPCNVTLNLGKRERITGRRRGEGEKELKWNCRSNCKEVNKLRDIHSSDDLKIKAKFCYAHIS